MVGYTSALNEFDLWLKGAIKNLKGETMNKYNFNEKKVKIPEGIITVNSVVSPTVAPPMNIRGTNLVSTRVIAEAVNAQVIWNNDTRTVEITY